MARLLASAVGLLGLGVLLSAGCSGSSFTDGGGGGSHSSAGATFGGAEPFAGASSGGSGTSGGSSNAGTPSGGSTSGGSSAGGTESGGSSAGGTASGGSSAGGSGTAGSGGGTSIGVCKQDSDCVQCDYVAVPSKASDCCTNCNWMPLTKRECDLRKAAHDKYCANIHPICPAIACVQPPEALCKEGMCVSGSAP